MGKPLQGGVEAEAALTDQSRAECLRRVVGKGPGKAAGNRLTRKQRTNEPVGKTGLLVGAQLSLPGAVTDSLGADRPEVRAAAEQHAVAQDQDTAVAALHPV